MNELAVVGDQSFTLGFRLAGVREIHNPESDEEFDSTVERLLDEEDVGIVVLRQEDMDRLSKTLRRTVRDSIDPIFVTLGGEGGEEDLREKIKRAIGVDLWQ